MCVDEGCVMDGDGRMDGPLHIRTYLATLFCFTFYLLLLPLPSLSFVLSISDGLELGFDSFTLRSSRSA